MGRNILDAIISLASNPIHELKAHYQGKNRANNMGEALELYIKDIFADTININDNDLRNTMYSQNFSYLGNQNNPPDAIIKNGDAIEVKKIESKNAGLALNSSYPKAKLFSDSTMITQECRTCEEWKEKDIIYVVGVIKDNQLMSLCMVYGVDYAASAEIYKRIKNVISEGISTISDIQFAETNELGRVNRVDPLGITYLRIRGMWGIQNPMKVFNYIYQENTNHKFNFMALINEEKYNSFDNESKQRFLDILNINKNISVSDVQINVPDNPAKLRNAKLVAYSF